jgi:tRNA-specific adenosine deaminase 3
VHIVRGMSNEKEHATGGGDLNVQEVLYFRELGEADAYVEVYVAEINPRKASTVLEGLTAAVPLQRYSLNHLKRVRRVRLGDGEDPIAFPDGTTYQFRLQVLICPVKEYEYLSEEVKHGFDVQDTDYLIKLCACKTPPQTRAEFETWSVRWPAMYRPTELNRSRETGTHSVDDMNMIRQYFSLVFKDGDDCIDLALATTAADASGIKAKGAYAKETNLDGGIVVNPENGLVLCMSSDFFRKFGSTFTDPLVQFNHPLHTTTMRCVELVATVARGEMEPPVVSLSHPNPLPDCATEDPSLSVLGAEVFTDEHYLCSGLDMYLNREPDLMSSMALVHSRIRRVYFRETSEHGALQTNTHLHSNRALNHRYRAFRVLGSLTE